VKTKLIKLNEEHYIIVDNSEIKEGDFMYDIDGDIGIAIGKDKSQWEGNRKITHSTKPLSFLNESGITTANLKPDWTKIKQLSGYSVEKMAENKWTEFDLLIKSLQQPTEWDVEFVNGKLTLKQ
jgi:hypothetical protein